MKLTACIRLPCVLVAMVLLLSGCTSNTAPKIIIELSYISTSSSAKLHYVNVISGGDKFHWYGVYSGEKKTITLYPGAQSDNKITLFYQFAANKQKQTWEGDEVQSELGYRIQIAIHENGEITEQSCSLPCNLTP
ncbi:hypothetical protein MNBD_GAMMA18-241 [hydrothermal vent metagenome]|uniref:Uncharacterized protein n=1 Tax=hydrothermal vent metagenome TaxID=652676 RepID=A0A3B0ZEW5_9ZZZZ